MSSTSEDPGDAASAGGDGVLDQRPADANRTIYRQYSAYTYRDLPEDSGGDGGTDDNTNGRADEEEEEEEGMPADLIVDHANRPSEIGSLITPVSAWEQLQEMGRSALSARARAALRVRRPGVHSGVLALVQLLLNDWETATAHCLGCVRVFTPQDVADVCESEHQGAFGKTWTAKLRDPPDYPVFIKGQPLDRQFAFELATLIYAYNVGVPIPALVGMYRMPKQGGVYEVYTVQAQSKGVPADLLFQRAEHRTTERMARFAYVAAWILAVVHEKGILHNDIALRNFLVGEEEHGSVELIDFGLSVVRGVNQHGRETDEPTPYAHDKIPVAQVAPEVVRNHRMTKAGDVFQLGWMLVDLFEDVPQDGMGFAARHIAQHEGGRDEWVHAMETQRPAKRPALCPEEVWEMILTRCLNVDPNERSSMRAVAEQLMTHAPEVYRGLHRRTSFRDACRWALCEQRSLEMLQMLMASCGCYFLDLSFGHLKAEHMGTLSAALQSNVTLNTLNVFANDFGDDGGEELANALRHNSTLTLLSMGSCNVSDHGAAALAAALLVNSTLHTLKLEGSRIGDDGAEALAKMLLENATLTSLKLESNAVSDRGAAALARALSSNRTLQALNVRRNRITDTGACELAAALEGSKNDTLHTLDIEQNKLSQAGKDALIAAQQASGGSLSTLRLDWQL